MKPHKHAALIHAWADGAVIQYKNVGIGNWVDVSENEPLWSNNLEYRIKPLTDNDRLTAIEKSIAEIRDFIGMNI